MILFLHQRYRTSGGEERTIDALRDLVTARLGEQTALLTRDSTGLSRSAAAAGLLGGGLAPAQVARSVRDSGARIVHAHNLHPTLGWRALHAARGAGARVVLHVHNYRLVCAVGVCVRDGRDCTSCHGANTLPGVVHDCRGSAPEALAYGAGLALWQRRLVAQADAVAVPSSFARERLRALGAPLPWERVHVLPPPVAHLERPPGPALDGHALVVSRLAPEKGVDVAIEACRRAGVRLVVAGDGPWRERLERQAAGADVRFEGRVDDDRLARLREEAALAIAPSLAPETFGLAAAEAMAHGLPVVGSAVGALAELLDDDMRCPPGDSAALSAAITNCWHNTERGALLRERIERLAAPAVVAGRLERLYGEVCQDHAP